MKIKRPDPFIYYILFILFWGIALMEPLTQFFVNIDNQNPRAYSILYIYAVLFFLPIIFYVRTFFIAINYVEKYCDLVDFLNKNDLGEYVQFSLDEKIK